MNYLIIINNVLWLIIEGNGLVLGVLGYDADLTWRILITSLKREASLNDFLRFVKVLEFTVSL